MRGYKKFKKFKFLVSATLSERSSLILVFYPGILGKINYIHILISIMGKKVLPKLQITPALFSNILAMALLNNRFLT